MNDRDTKFSGFAELLQDDLRFLSEEEKRLRIAQRAYDLIYSSLDIESIKLLDMTPEEVIQKHIPDLTQWPESPGSLPDARVEQEPSNDQLL